jgi:hypothetical protein
MFVRCRGSHIFLHNRLTDGSWVSALRSGRALRPENLPVLIPVRVSANPRAVMGLEVLSKLKTFNDLIGTRARDLPACNVASQPSTLPFVPHVFTA